MKSPKMHVPSNIRRGQRVTRSLALESGGEVDNCPVCGTTTVLQFGLKEGAFSDSEEEMPWGICSVCGSKFRRREESTPDDGTVYYEVWSCWTPEIDLKIVKIHPRHCRWKTVKTRQMVTDSL